MCGKNCWLFFTGVWTIVASLYNIFAFSWAIRTIVLLDLGATTVLALSITFLALFVAWLISGILLFVSYCQKNKHLLLPWLIITILVCLFYILIIISVFVAIGMLGSSFGGLAAKMASVTFVVCSIYGLMFVFCLVGEIIFWKFYCEDGYKNVPQAGIAYPQAGIAYTQAGIAYPQAGIAYTQAGIAYPQAGNSYPHNQEMSNFGNQKY